jgi:LPXTG-motif cell wall-anchored protein
MGLGRRRRTRKAVQGLRSAVKRPRMRIRTLVLMIILISGISRGFGADEAVVAKNGDSYSVSQSTDSSGGTTYELQRSSSQGNVTTLWRNRPRTTSAPLLLSRITAIYEEGGEVSLLLHEGEADGLVFRFASTATTAAPIRVRSLRRVGDHSRGLRFKQHGELIFDLPKNSIEKVVRFDAKGEVISDFRPRTKGVRISDPRVPARPAQTDRESTSSAIDPGNQSPEAGSANPGTANSQPERNSEPSFAAVEPQLDSTSWPLWAGIILGTLALLYLIFKKREKKE